MATVSNEYIEAREDELARFITASELVDNLRRCAEVLYKRDRITPALYHDMRDTITYIDGTLLIGKQNTATLRNSRVRGEDHGGY
jgi:hypothetical protein